MQISRHWRLNAQRYRLQGVRYENGEVRLNARHVSCGEERIQIEKPAQARVTVTTGR